MRSWEDGPKCPSGEHELAGPWVKFCDVCQAYTADMEHYLAQGLPGLEAKHRAQDDRKANRRPGVELSPQLQVLLGAGDPDELEETVRKRVSSFLEQMGFAVYKLEQGYRPDACQACGVAIPVRGSRQTLGLADILVAGQGTLFFVEFKRPKQKKRGGFVSNRSPEQLQFERDCAGAGVKVFLWRSLEDAQAWFTSHQTERRG